jgi:hypothetical protein
MDTPDSKKRDLSLLNDPWILRIYNKKQLAIQIKPPHNKHIHFSIVWGDISKKDFKIITEEIQAFLDETPSLSFKILRPCANCTYGRFDAAFEDLIMDFRKRFKGISTKKDLPLDHEQHQDLRIALKGTWDEEHPIIFHIHDRPRMHEGGDPDEVDDLFRKLMLSDETVTFGF